VAFEAKVFNLLLTLGREDAGKILDIAIRHGQIRDFLRLQDGAGEQQRREQPQRKKA
jgi:hypothetical protein